MGTTAPHNICGAFVTDHLTLRSLENFSSPVVIRVLEPRTRVIEAIAAPQWREGRVIGQGAGMRFHPEPLSCAETRGRQCGVDLA